MIRINQIKVSVDRTDTASILRRKAADCLRIPENRINRLDIIRQSVDARKKPELFFSYTVDLEVAQEEKIYKKIKNPQVSLAERHEYVFPFSLPSGAGALSDRPVIIGTGPAGLFCGYFLAKAGFSPILLERGKDVDRRIRDVEAFWREGNLDPGSNVQFGEGGAGTFSDGKLNTLVKDKGGRNMTVLRTFVEMGAKESILYEAKPHIGTDVLCDVVKNIRNEIIRLGGEVRFDCQMTGIRQENGHISGLLINGKEEISCKTVVLAIGHSARDTFEMLYENQIPMEAKAFAVGLRVEHPQEMINESQYGRKDSGILGAAPYKVTAQTSVGRGVYSFCMCPGGYVVNASSEEGRLAVNGMSYSGRDGVNANSAVIVSVTPADYGEDHPLAGIRFQRRLEERAFQLGNGKIPVQRYGDFKKCVDVSYTAGKCDVTVQKESECNSQLTVPQNKGGYVWADVSRILPDECNRAFVEGMACFGRMIPGFDRSDAVLSGVESRTSSPVRIHRDETLQCCVKGLYPCGEGAGYAGGITSAAMDGIRVAEAVAKSLVDGYGEMQ